MVCNGKTNLSAQEFLQRAQEIERSIGRQPSFRNGPRPIDIDIIFYDNLHILQDDLIVPHERVAERAFVLAPLAEIAPALVDPISGKTVKELLDAITQDGVKKIAANLRIHWNMIFRMASLRYMFVSDVLALLASGRRS